METWKEVLCGKIPDENYAVSLLAGEESGLVIKLESFNHTVTLSFGAIIAYRMLDEGTMMERWACEDAVRFHADGFRNVIYEIVDGDFDIYVKRISCGQYEFEKMQHYILLTENYYIDIISRGEPDVDIEEEKP